MNLKNLLLYSSESESSIKSSVKQQCRQYPMIAQLSRISSIEARVLMYISPKEVDSAHWKQIPSTALDITLLSIVVDGRYTRPIFAIFFRFSYAER
ncbi:hypothetical protein P5V15_011956 [Pogonomyrmex californicus]